jgi:hypothetical protein
VTRLRLSRAAAACATVGLACAGPAPIVVEHTYDVRPGVLAKVAVVPLYPHVPVPHAPGDPPADAADLVSRFVSEALAAKGVEVVAPSDVVVAFEGAGVVLPRQDPAAAARLVADRFGATGVLLGRLHRYREREGGAAGAVAAASVAFEVELHAAPDAVRVFGARFDQTQPAFSSDPLTARHYPGGGSRWLTAAELARFGAEKIVESIPEALR